MQTNLLNLAKQGNADAIATLMNRQLQSQGITAKVALQDSCIYVLLESAIIPNQKTIAPFVFQGMMKLAVEVADSLQLYGKQTGEKHPSWSQAYSLSKAKSSLTDTLIKNIQDITTEVESSARVNSLKEVTLTESLNSIANHLQNVLANDKINIKVISEDKLLKIIAETDQLLDGGVFTERIFKELKNFDLSKFETVGIYKQKLKSGKCFQLKSFLLTSSEPETLEPKNSEARVLQTQLSTSKSSKSNQLKSQSQKIRKPKIRIGRILGIVVIVVVAGFVLIKLMQRILILVFLSPVLGSFSVILSFFFIWRSYPFLMFLFQKLLTLLIDE